MCILSVPISVLSELTKYTRILATMNKDSEVVRNIKERKLDHLGKVFFVKYGKKTVRNVL